MIDFAHRRLDHLGHFAHDRAFGNPVDRLLDDAHRLAHFFHADQVPVVGVAVCAGRNFEIEFGVSRVRLGFPQIPLHAAGAQHRTGHAERNAIGGRDHANIPGALNPDAVGGEQRFVFVDLRREERQKILYVFFEAGVSLILAAADTKRVRGQPRAAILFENLENLFAIPERIKQRRHRADI